MNVDNEELKLIVEKAVWPMEQKLDAHIRDAAEERIRVDGLVQAHARLADRVNEHGRQLTEISSSLASVAKSAATAAELAAEALRSANRSQDDMAKMVASAMSIHNVQIATTVSTTLKEELAPVAGRVEELEKNDEQQNKTLKGQDDKLDAIFGVVTKLVGNRWLRIALVVGGFSGAGLGGYLASQVKSAPTMLATPTPQQTPPAPDAGK